MGPLALLMVAVVLEGVVTDPHGAPVAAATVEVWSDAQADIDGTPARAPEATARTDADGRYALAVDVDVEARSLLLLARAQGLLGRIARVERSFLDGGRIPVHRLALRPLPPREPPRDEELVARTLRVLEGERPVPRAIVWHDRREVGRTDDHGRVEVSVPRDATALQVKASVVGQPSVTVLFSAKLPAHVLHAPCLDARLTGTAALDAAAEKGHTLRGTVRYEGPDGLVVWAVLGGTGAFSLPVPSGAAGTLVVRPWEGVGFCGNGFVPFVVPEVRVPVVAGAADLRVEVPEGSIEGRVVGSTGLGIAATQVVAHLADGRRLEVGTSWWGRFRFWNLPPGLVRLEVRDGPDIADALVRVPAGKRVDVTLRTP